MGVVIKNKQQQQKQTRTWTKKPQRTALKKKFYLEKKWLWRVVLFMFWFFARVKIKWIKALLSVFLRVVIIGDYLWDNNMHWVSSWITILTKPGILILSSLYFQWPEYCLTLSRGLISICWEINKYIRPYDRHQGSNHSFCSQEGLAQNMGKQMQNDGAVRWCNERELGQVQHQLRELEDRRL